MRMVPCAQLPPLFSFSSPQLASPRKRPDPPRRDWHAAWITHPTAPLREPLVLHFRRALDLPAAPASYMVRVSADNRFILYVNGQRVGDGPARGDLTHWRYERFDLAPCLHAGDEPHHRHGVELRHLRARRADERPHRISAGERSDRDNGHQHAEGLAG